jgi:hypothetical protein
VSSRIGTGVYVPPTGYTGEVNSISKCTGIVPPGTVPALCSRGWKLHPSGYRWCRQCEIGRSYSRTAILQVVVLRDRNRPATVALRVYAEAPISIENMNAHTKNIPVNAIAAYLLFIGSPPTSQKSDLLFVSRPVSNFSLLLSFFSSCDFSRYCPQLLPVLPLVPACTAPNTRRLCPGHQPVLPSIDNILVWIERFGSRKYTGNK